VFLGGVPYYVRDNQACEHLKADFRAAEKRRADRELAAAEEQERNAKANPQAPDETITDELLQRAQQHSLQDAFDRAYAWITEPSITAIREPPLLRVGCRRHTRKPIFGP
jgi:predicted component of type VI protein secretion system